MKRIILKLFSLCWFPKIRPSNEPIDIIVPLIRKDLKIFPLCLKGIQSCVTNKVKNIYIVSPPDPLIIDFCQQNDLTFVNEATVLGISPDKINLKVKNEDDTISDRSGWLFQQLIKLSGKVGECENYLCIDSDHILIHPHTFVDKNNIPVFYMSSEHHTPYYTNITRLIGSQKFSYLSYVAHKMIFNKTQVNLLQQEIENLKGQNWMKAIIDSYDRKEGAGFSEFELYGNFTMKKKIRPWKERALTYKELTDYNTLKRKYSKYNALTFPEYLNS